MTLRSEQAQYWLAVTIIVAGLVSCRQEQHTPPLRFTSLKPTDTNVDFENTLHNDDDFNIIEYLYYYNGGGIALGDINSDGLTDLYFSANQQSNRLYLNKGAFQFEDITERAGVAGEGNWKTGVAMADVNGDGLLDIYSCAVGGYKKFNGQNRLYINKGDLTFADSTEAYGLSFQGFSSQAAFFDYDNDGDLDLFLVNHAVHTVRSIGPAMMRFQSDAQSGDKLYRNERIETGKTFFREVTSSAGILSSAIGYGLGVAISDLNNDGFMDVYVSNDFHENDYLYINQGDGTFVEQLPASVPHTSRFSMGVDIADINNDGWSDIFSLDMLPRDDGVIKTTAGEDPYDIYEFKLRFGYHYQFARNTLQLNRGLDHHGDLIFSDIAPYAGVEATDWSWGPVIADFDNDGMKDIFVANGIVGRPNDLDYINYISNDSAQRFLSDKDLIAHMPSGAVPNLFFRNVGDLRFEEVSVQWIGNEATLSNGAASADLDNDGDLDLVVNNINSPASIFRNDHDPAQGSFLKVSLEGSTFNVKGVGARVTVYQGENAYMQEQVPTRGWLSATDHVMHFGLATKARIDSITVRWPGDKGQIVRQITPGQTVVFKYADAVARTVVPDKVPKKPHNKTTEQLLKPGDNLFRVHRENQFIAFNQERLIPTALSMQGPAAAVADVDRDGRDDIYLGGGRGQAGMLYMQQRDNGFRQAGVQAFEADSLHEDVDAVFFNADGDDQQDLLIVSGGQEVPAPGQLQPRLYHNLGSGRYRPADGLPVVDVNASCVRPGDFDNDGDIDLFIGSNVVPGHYGANTRQLLWRNMGGGKFEDVSSQLLPPGIQDSAGMVTDALWVDVNGDRRPDLVLVGEWMPVTILLQQENGRFIDGTRQYGLEKSNGWWRCVISGDFDHDGDIDLVAGNFGLNSRLRPAPDQPVHLYLSDVDGNGSTDPIMTYNNQGVSHPFISRDQLVKQVPALKRKFVSYSNFRNVTIDMLLNPQVLTKRMELYTMATSYLENKQGRFVRTDMPVTCQFSSVEAMAVVDVDGDGNDDVVMVGNTDAVQPDISRADASYGDVMLGDGHGHFSSIEPSASGFVVRGQARKISLLRHHGAVRQLIVSRNNDRPLVFVLSRARH